MREYRFLIPVGPDNEPRGRHPGRRWDALKHALIEVAGGYTDAGVVEGAWRDNGSEVCEPCRHFFVSVSPYNEHKLWAMFYLFREKFTQQSIYVASGGECWLINSDSERPPKESLAWARRALRLSPQSPDTLDVFQESLG
jgi:hypothetical protein